ncbi:MAG: metallophosphoesterase family protein, partial [Roseiflexaceae bacterium]|nr:metallophosphoesterase family protein [Roseiflexaceae bacterium]
MNIAVISDIHGNLAALEAVAADLARWQPAVVIVAGDLVNRGPQPLECLAFCFAREREDGWRLLRGNHEEYVLSILADPSARAGAEEAVRENVRWTAARVGDVAPIRALPTQISLAGPDGGEMRIVHASMRHDRDNILADTPDEELRAKIAPAPPVFCCGHTHRPLVRRLDSTLVVNAGAVGLPFDGDPRSSYARLSWDGGGWQA